MGYARVIHTISLTSRCLAAFRSFPSNTQIALTSFSRSSWITRYHPRMWRYSWGVGEKWSRWVMRVPSLVVWNGQFRISRATSSRGAYKTTTFPRSSLNRDGTFLSTWGLVVASEPRRESVREVKLTFSSGEMEPIPKPPSVKTEGATVAVCGRIYATRDPTLSLNPGQRSQAQMLATPTILPIQSER